MITHKRMEVTFNYNGEDMIFYCKDAKQKISDIFHILKDNVDINSIIFLYGGSKVDGDISVGKIINDLDSQRNKMTILVMDNNDDNAKPCWIQSKDIICPLCGESARLDISEYKILLQCKKNHNRGNIFLDELENTQKIDISKIICDECKKNNKANSYKNIFYKCNQCGHNLCINCQDKHQNDHKEHNIINYDDKNYICEIHNEKYSSYCYSCKKNICIFCEKEHEKYKGHNYKNYVKLLPDMKKAKINMEELKNKITEFKGILDDLINRLNKVKNTIDYFYQIKKQLFDLVVNKCINYEILSSFNRINKSEIINDIKNIVNNKDKNEIFMEINEIYKKITSKFCEEITIQYKLEENKIDIFGENFVAFNKENCSMIINGKEYEIKETIENKDLSVNNNILEIKLKNIQNVTNMGRIFDGCSSLISLPDMSEWNTINVNNMSFLFAGCTSLKSLPDISKWNTINVKRMDFLFCSCTSLLSLPDISKWNTSNVSDMSGMFDSCTSLISLPDISKWNTTNLKETVEMFISCRSLKELPDISKWNTNNLEDISRMFIFCTSLKTLPDFSRWNITKVKDLSSLFMECSSLISLPDISKWDTSNVKNMEGMFYGCSSLVSIPDISKWNIVNVENLESLFQNCSSLFSIPDISKWNTNNIKKISKMFCGCSSLKSLPDLTKWNISNAKRNDMFLGCDKLEKIPEFKK